MDKICRIGTIATWRGRRMSIYVHIEIKEGNLSITGVEGPLPSGNCLGGCGQIDGNYDHADKSQNDSRTDKPIKASNISYAPGWNAAQWLKLLDIWSQWHLNDMSPACEHQRALGWMDEKIDPDRPAMDYGKFYPGQSQDSWNLKMWAYPPHGHLTEPCPVCGYKMGTAWLKRELPVEVKKFLFDLPESDKNPAWV